MSGISGPAARLAHSGNNVEEADETTRLLAEPESNSKPPREENNETHAGVHYKNIDRNRFWCLFGSVLVAYILVWFDGFFMASSHPVITSYFNASNAASWLSTVFFLSSTIFGPLYGRISDVTGRRRMFVFALSVFALTTAWCGYANSIGSFIAARFFCGLGAGGVSTMSNIILSDIVKIEYRGIYQSYLNVCFGLGNGLGASMGGILCDHLGWRAAFLIQVPLIIALLLFSAWATPDPLGPSLAKAEGKSVAQALASFDFVGAFCLTITMTGLILGINLGGNILGWLHPLVIVSLVIFVCGGVALVFVEQRALRPLLPLNLLSSVPYANLNWGNTFGAMLSAAANFNIPIFLQAVKGMSPTKSGLMLLSPLIGVTVVSVAAGVAISWTRKLKPFVSAGAVCQFAGIMACGFLQERFSVIAIIAVIPWVVIGQGLFFPASTVSTLAMSNSDNQAVVVTTLNLTRSLGSILGVAVSSWILQNVLPIVLRSKVTGNTDQKERIIHAVRKSIKAIADLDPKHKKEVVEAYESSLRFTFLGCGLLGLSLCAVILPVRIPNLQEIDSSGTRSTKRRSRSQSPAVNEEQP